MNGTKSRKVKWCGLIEMERVWSGVDWKCTRTSASECGSENWHGVKDLRINPLMN